MRPKGAYHKNMVAPRREPVRYDSSKIVAAPKYEPLKMTPYTPPINPRQDEIDAYRKIKSLVP